MRMMDLRLLPAEQRQNACGVTNRVEWSAPNLAERSEALTTLKTLHEMVRAYLEPREEYKSWRMPEQGLIPLRPEDERLEKGIQEFNSLWDLLKELPSYKKLEQGAKTGSLRRFSHDREPGKDICCSGR